MPEEKYTYKVGENIVDISPDKKEDFLSNFPDAVPMKSFIVGNDTVDITPDKEQDFLAKFPDAKPTFNQPAEWGKATGGVGLPIKNTDDNLEAEQQTKESYEDYKARLNKIQPGLGEETPDYDLKGAWEGGLEPSKSDDGLYHLGSRNPLTGALLKTKEHPTYDKMIQGEEDAGYEVYEKDGKMYSRPVDPEKKRLFEESKASTDLSKVGEKYSDIYKSYSQWETEQTPEKRDKVKEDLNVLSGQADARAGKFNPVFYDKELREKYKSTRDLYAALGTEEGKVDYFLNNSDLPDDEKQEARHYIRSQILAKKKEEEFKRQWEKTSGGLKLPNEQINDFAEKYKDLAVTADSLTTTIQNQAEKRNAEFTKELEKQHENAKLVAQRLSEQVNSGVIGEEDANEILKKENEALIARIRRYNNTTIKSLNDAQDIVVDEYVSKVEKLKKDYGIEGEGFSEEMQKRYQDIFKQIEANNKKEVLDNWNNMSRADQVELSLESGIHDMFESLGGGLKWMGAYEVGNVLTDEAQKYYEDNKIPEFNFDNSGLGSADWWIANGVRSLPFTVALMAPGMGVGAGLTSAVARLGVSQLTKSAIVGVGGALAMRPMEEFLESGATFENAMKQGYTLEESSEMAAERMRRGMSLITNDALQVALAFLPTKRIGAKILSGIYGVGSEGGEEVYQEYLSYDVEAQRAEGMPEMSLIEFAKTDAGKTAMVLGSATGTLFTAPSIIGYINPESTKEQKKLATEKSMKSNVLVKLFKKHDLKTINERKDNIKKIIDINTERGTLTTEEAEAAKQEIDRAAEVEGIMSNAPDAHKVKAQELLQEIDDLNSEKEAATNDVFAKTIQTKIDEVQSKLEELVSGTYQGYFVGFSEVTKEQMIKLLNNPKFIKHVLNNKDIEINVSNDPDIEKLLLEKLPKKEETEKAEKIQEINSQLEVLNKENEAGIQEDESNNDQERLNKLKKQDKSFARKIFEDPNTRWKRRGEIKRLERKISLEEFNIEDANKNEMEFLNDFIKDLESKNLNEDGKKHLENLKRRKSLLQDNPAAYWEIIYDRNASQEGEAYDKDEVEFSKKAYEYYNGKIESPKEEKVNPQVDSEYIKSVFPETKITEPVYHVTNQEFDEFDNDKVITGGFYFTKGTPRYKGVIDKEGKGERVVTAIINLKNPLVKDTEFISESINDWELIDRLRKEGYDGIVDDEGHREVIVFDSENIQIVNSEWTTKEQADVQAVSEQEGESEKPIGQTKKTFNDIPVRIGRFEAGKKLNDKEKKEVLKGLQDAYKINGAEQGIKGVNKDGDVIEGYLPNQYDYMETSDITGQKIRFYITLDDGTIAHPSELFPSISNKNILSEILGRELNEKSANREYQKGLEQIENKSANKEVISVIQTAIDHGAKIVTERPTGDDFGVASSYLDFGNGNTPSIPDYAININGSFMGMTEQEYRDAVASGDSKVIQSLFRSKNIPYTFDYERFFNENPEPVKKESKPVIPIEKGDRVKFNLGGYDYDLPAAEFKQSKAGTIVFDLFGQKSLKVGEYQVEKAEQKEIDANTVFKNPVDKNNPEFTKSSDEFKEIAGKYDDGINDKKFKEENLKTEEISIDDIVPTQDKLYQEHLKKEKEGIPFVIKIGDKYYAEDGHHRIADAINNGDETVEVEVYESKPSTKTSSKKPNDKKKNKSQTQPKNQETVKEKQMRRHNNLVSEVQTFNNWTPYKRRTKNGESKLNRIQTMVRELSSKDDKYTIRINRDGSVTVKRNGGELRTWVEKTSKEDVKAHKTLNEYEDQGFKDMVNTVVENPDIIQGLQYFDIQQKTRLKEQAIRDIKAGKKSVQANYLLDTLEKYYELGYVEFVENDKGTTNHYRVGIKEFLDIVNEVEEAPGLTDQDYSEISNILSDAEEFIGEEVTIDNLPKLKDAFFGGFPYTQSDYDILEKYLQNEKENKESKGPESADMEEAPISKEDRKDQKDSQKGKKVKFVFRDGIEREGEIVSTEGDKLKIKSDGKVYSITAKDIISKDQATDRANKFEEKESNRIASKPNEGSVFSFGDINIPRGVKKTSTAIKKWWGIDKGGIKGTARALLKMKGRIAAENKRAERIIKEYQKALKKVYGGKVSEAEATKIDNALKSLGTSEGDYKNALKEIDPRLHEHLIKMRRHIDNLTFKLKEIPWLSNEIKVVFDANTGYYLTRSYQYRNNKEWTWDNIPLSIKKDAFETMASLFPEKTDEELEGMLRAMLESEEVSGLFGGDASLGAMNLGILKHRSEFLTDHPTLRKFLGEFTDPVINYATSVAKMQTLLEKHKFLTELTQIGLETGVLKEEADSEHYVKIGIDHPFAFYFDSKDEAYKVRSGKAKKNLKPINQYYTTPEIKEALAEFEKTSNKPGALYKSYIAFTTAVKASKTAGSVRGIIRNFMSNPINSLANDNFLNIPSTIKEMNLDMSSWSNFVNSYRNMLLELMEEGMLGQNIDKRSVEENIRELSSNKDVIYYYKKNKLKKVAEFPIKIAWQAFSFGDDFWKAQRYFSEKAKYRKVFQKRFPNNPTKVEEETRRTAAEILHRTQAFYDLLPEVGQLMRKVPVSGSFIAFPMITTYNIAQSMYLGIKETQSKDTAVIGIRRILGVITALTVIKFVAKMINDKTDIEPEDLKNFRRFMPKYWKNDILAITKNKGNGKFTYTNLSFTDFYGAVTKPMSVIIDDFSSGGVSERTFIDVIFATAEPYIDPEISAQIISDLYNNYSARNGKRIYDKKGDIKDMAKDILLYTWEEGLVPGTINDIQQIRRLNRQDRDWQGRLKGMLTGFQSRDTDLAHQFKRYKMKEYLDDIQFHVTKYRDFKYAKSGDKALEALGITEAEAKAKAEKNINRVLREMRMDFDALLALGVGYTDAYLAIKEARDSNGRLPHRFIKAAVISNSFDLYIDDKGSLGIK